ncbi:hypothetical protein J4425_00900 [Candidatus Woesearchaeota archaeon]|nr:hypothetical protein [Candidatus Woesearchaeota archaeon]
MAFNWVTFMSVYSVWFWLILAWSGIWQGISLWRSARNRHLTWFVILFITSTLGILPIIYLLIHGRKNKAVPKKKTSRKKK